MTYSEYAIALRRANRWASVAYVVTAVSLMLCLTGLVFMRFSDIRDMSMIFRDMTKPLAEDGAYGAWMGLCIGVTIGVPSLVLPLWPVAVIHRKLGVTCPHCSCILTWGRRPIQMKNCGTCSQCQAVVLVPGSSVEAEV